MSHWMLRLAGAIQEQLDEDGALPPEPSDEAVAAAKAVDDAWTGLYSDDFYTEMLRAAYAAEIVQAELAAPPTEGSEG